MAADAVTAPETPAFSLTTPEVDPTFAIVPFDLDGVILHATRPKMAILLDMAGALVMEGVSEQQKLAALRDFLVLVLDEEAYEHIDRRLLDPKDKLDVDILDPLFQHLVGLWYGRPTTSLGASQPQRRTSGKRSTARSRSAGSTRKR